MARTPIDQWFASQSRAVFTRAELLEHFSRHSLDSAVREGRITRILPDFYVDSTRDEECATRAEAMSRWCSQALISGTAALALMGIGIDSPDRIAVVLPYGANPRMPVWSQVRRLDRSSTSVWVGQVRCVPPPIAVVDAWHRATRREDQAIVYRCLWDRIASARELAGALEEFPRVRDRARLIRLLEHFERGATSPLEVIAKTRVFRGRGFSALEWQAELVVAGRRRRIDALHRAARVALEFDGRAYHDSPLQWRLDRERDAELAAAGLTTMRFTFEDLSTRPDWCRMQFKAAVSARLGLSSRT